jgi:glycosyltransferase involved in cell wall biosynthesis
LEKVHAVNVLHVLPFPGIGGTEIATRRVAEAVRPFGVQSSALLLRPAADLQAYIEEGGIACLDGLQRPEPSLLRNALSFLSSSRALARTFQAFDIIHCADIHAAYYVAVAGRLAGKPVLCHIRNRAARIGQWERIFVGAASHFAAVSRDTLDHFPIRLRPSRTTVLYDGIDIPPRAAPAERAAAAHTVRSEFGLPKDAVVAAMFARVNQQKDYPTLIRAAALLREAHPALRFLIVGDNARVETNRRHFAEVQDLARRSGVLDRFVFAGFRTDVARLMLAADLCVLCTHFEGLPLVLIEAMAAERACVATAVDGIPEALTDGVTGLLHQPGDAEGLATAIAKLIAAPVQRGAMGAAARVDAERRFSRDRFARDVRALYEGLSGTRGMGRHRAEATRAAAG